MIPLVFLSSGKILDFILAFLYALALEAFFWMLPLCLREVVTRWGAMELAKQSHRRERARR